MANHADTEKWVENAEGQVNNNKKIDESKAKGGVVRHVVAILALSSIFLANINRQAFNQALVSMTRPIRIVNTSIDPQNLNFSSTPVTDMNEVTRTTLVTSATIENAEFTTITSNTTVLITEFEEDDDRFDWTASQIAILQSAFSYGYTPFMILGGRLSEIYGAKWVIFISGFGSAICCLLSPLFADLNFYLLVGTRVFMGLCQTGVSPALFALLVRWMPPEESNVYLPMLKVGVMIGFTSGALVSGFTTWRVTFYLLGVTGMLWSIMWALLITSDPSSNRFISKLELDYVQTEIAKASKGRKQPARKASAPWSSIFTNPVVLAFTFTKFTVKLSTEAQATQIPMYLKKVFDVSRELNGMLVATNFAIQSVFTGFVAYTAKEFVVKKTFGFNKTQVRRLFQGLSSFGMATAYILITFNVSLLEIVCVAIVILSIAAMFGAGGEAVTPVDLSLEYSATIMAIANSAANLSGIVLPNVVSFVLDEHLIDSAKWNMVWMFIGFIIFMGGLAYTCIVTAELQDFSQKPKKEITKKTDSLEIEMSDIPL